MSEDIVKNFLLHVDSTAELQKAYDALTNRKDVLAFAKAQGFDFTEEQFLAHFADDAFDLYKLARGITARNVNRPCPCLP